MDKQYVQIKVIGHQTEVSEFVKLVAFINACATSGHHGTVELHIDGDGSAGNLKILDEKDNDRLIVPENVEEFISKCEKEGELWIGE